MIHRVDIVHAARPLRHIFWGALLVLLDVTFVVISGGEGFRIDILNDTVGMALITAALPGCVAYEWARPTQLG